MPRLASWDDVAKRVSVPRRIMFVQLKSGFDLDRGPSWIAWVTFSRTWKTAYVHGRTLRRHHGLEGNFVDVDSGEEFWLSGPKRDQTDTRYGPWKTSIDDDTRAEYSAFIAGEPLPGCEAN